MDAKKSSDIRQRLSREYENLIKSINRNRMAAEEIKLENTEDEADRATISHNKVPLYNLHESDFMRLRVIQEALNVLDRGLYSQCVRCGENINEKRLVAVPSAPLCIGCQEEVEKDDLSSRLVQAGLEGEETEPQL